MAFEQFGLGATLRSESGDHVDRDTGAAKDWIAIQNVRIADDERACPERGRSGGVRLRDVDAGGAVWFVNCGSCSSFSSICPKDVGDDFRGYGFGRGEK
jgi:hypothetical protein